MILFLILSLTVSSTYCYDSNNIICDREKQVSFITNPTYSDKWNETVPAPIYAANQQCQWKVHVPVASYALFTMEANIGVDSVLKITDINNNSERVMTSDQQPYVFVGSWFLIDLTVGPNGAATSFGFKVQWFDFPTPHPKNYTVTKTSDALYFDEMLSENSVVVTAETRVSLIAFPSDVADLTPLLRLTLVFDGPDMNSPYLGTLFQALRCSKPMVSSKNQMTVFTFQENYVIGSYFVIQDYYNVQNLTELKGITCWSQSSCPVTLNAASGPVGAMTLNLDDQDEFIKQLDLSSDAILKIYIGARREDDESNLIASYNSFQSKTNIPQKFNGDIMTYYLEKGTALVELAEDSNYTRWNDAVNGRAGFITSRQLGILCDWQDLYESIGGLMPDQTFVFTVNVSYVDLSNDARLTITFDNLTGQKEYLFSKDTATTPTVFTESSNNMTVSYFTNATLTKGFYLGFKIGPSFSPASLVSTVMTFLIVFISLL